MEGNDYVNLLCVRINSDKERIEKRQWDKIEVDCFNLADFWNQFGSAVQALSNEVTKICFATGQKPFPSRADVDSMLTDLTQFYTVMRDLYLVLPDEVGATVYDAVTSALVKILVALIAIVRSLNDISEQGAKERLSLTGTLWDACNAVESLPRDNLLAVLSVIEDESSLAKDAQDELSTVWKEKQDSAEEQKEAGKRKAHWIDEQDNPIHLPPSRDDSTAVKESGPIHTIVHKAAHFPDMIVSSHVLHSLQHDDERLLKNKRTKVSRPDGTWFRIRLKNLKKCVEEYLAAGVTPYYVDEDSV